MINSILVVCEGNICRSPMAQGLLAAYLPAVQVVSAGLRAPVGRPADPIAVQLMAERGIDISSHNAALLSVSEIRTAELILAMTQAHRKDIEVTYPFARGKVYRMGEFTGIDVRDPYRQARVVFEKALEEIEQSTKLWLDTLAKLIN
ncbi:low molecular weight phosphotyrosine protein phosphatase [Paraburkholderia metrosideri]|uniref:protein-tyrosine-phosphatase n=1 Tax=Paraburkholderia metrosideri TaxID=580937 RepID=A0ABW9E3J4_9BURK